MHNLVKGQSAPGTIGSTRFGDFPIEYSAKNHNGSTFVDLEMYTRDGQLRR